jgi:hypothetical protein
VARLSPEAQRSLQALRRGLIHDLPALLKNEMIGAVDEEAAALVDLMKSVAPVDVDAANGAPPGTLRDSHNYILQEGGLRAVIKAGDGIDYAIHVEQGTKHAPPHSWFWPSYRLRRTAIRRRLARGVTKAIKFWNMNGRPAR